MLISLYSNSGIGRNKGKHMSKQNEWINQAKARITLKREISGAVRRELESSDFVFPETRSFPIQRPEDVEAAVSSWGRATAVRARGFTFEDFQRRLIRLARRKGPSFVAALPPAWEVEAKGVTGSPSDIYAHGPGGLLSVAGLGKRKKDQVRPSFSVFKDASGRYRWIMVSSSAYVDRDGEIVSMKALTQAVAEQDTLGERGPLLWWHLPIKLGNADFGMMYGRMLVESGTFINEAVGKAVRKKATTLGGSIGFKHPVTEPGSDGIFHKISQFERSLLPRNKASNYFTSLMVKERKTMSAEKVKELVELIGGPEEVAKLLGEISATDKQAQEAGFTYKSQTDLEAMTGDEGLEYFLMLKEHEEAEAAKAAEVEAAKAEAEKVKQEGAEAGRDVMGLLDRIMTMLEKHEEAITSLTEALSKDQKQENAEDEEEGEVVGLMNRVKEMLEKHDAAIKTLSEGTAEKQTREQVVAERLAALESDQPRAVQNGYRASQKSDVVKDEKLPEPDNPNAEVIEKVKEKQPETAPFLEGANVFTQTLPGNAPPEHPFWGGPQPAPE